MPQAPSFGDILDSFLPYLISSQLLPVFEQGFTVSPGHLHSPSTEPSTNLSPKSLQQQQIPWLSFYLSNLGHPTLYNTTLVRTVLCVASSPWLKKQLYWEQRSKLSQGFLKACAGPSSLTTLSSAAASLFRSQGPCFSSSAYDQLWPGRTYFPVLSPQSILISDTPVPLLFLLQRQSTWPKRFMEGWVRLAHSPPCQGGQGSRGLGWLVMLPAVRQQKDLTAVTLLAFSSFLFCTQSRILEWGTVRPTGRWVQPSELHRLGNSLTDMSRGVSPVWLEMPWTGRINYPFWIDLRPWRSSTDTFNVHGLLNVLSFLSLYHLPSFHIRLFYYFVIFVCLIGSESNPDGDWGFSLL